MWNPSASWQRRLRLVAGVLALLALLGCPALLLGPLSPLASSVQAVQSHLGARDLTVPLGRDSLPDELRAHRLAGVAVYRQTEDGGGTMVGRVRREGAGGLALVLPGSVAVEHLELLYALPVENLEGALTLLLAPDGVDGELELARQQLVPVLRQHLVTRMESHLEETLADLVQDLPEQHGEDVEVLLGDLEEALAPETESLISSLVERSWETVGIWGVTVGVARKATEATRRLLHDGEGKVREALGEEHDEEEPSVAFLDEDRTRELREGLEQELEGFWRERGNEVLRTAGAVLEAHSSTTLEGLKEDWLEQLQERVLEASWQEGREEVLDEVSRYATGFVSRRLVTRRGGPTLSLAYAIRSATHITRRPLLVLQRAAAPTGATLPLRPYVTSVSAAPDRREPR